MNASNLKANSSCLTASESSASLCVKSYADARKRYEDLPDILTTQEVATYLGVHVKTIREYIKYGKIRATPFGKHYRIRKEWIIDFLEENNCA